MWGDDTSFNGNPKAYGQEGGPNAFVSTTACSWVYWARNPNGNGSGVRLT